MTVLDYANLTTGPGRRERRLWWKSALWGGLWTGLAGVVLFGCSGVLVFTSEAARWYGLAAAVVILFIPIVLLIGAPLLIIVVIDRLLRAIRRRRGQIVFEYVEQGVRLNLPLPRWLYAASQTEAGKTRQRLLAAQALVSAGVPVGVALDEAVGELPKRAVMMAMAGERNGCLDTALSQFSKEMRRKPEQDLMAGTLYLIYPLFVVGTLSLIANFVMPRMAEILADFRMPIRGPWLLLVHLEPVAPVLGLLFALILAVVIGMLLWQIFMPGRWDDSYANDALQTVLWLVPGGRGYLRDRGLGDVCSVAADALAAGRPLPDALLEVSMVQLPPPVRARVNEWRHGVEAGLSADEAAQRARMPDLLVGMVRTGLASGNLAGSLRFLSRYYRARFSRSAELARGALIPILVLVMGVVVLGVALTLFIPLVDMLDAATLYTEVWP